MELSSTRDIIEKIKLLLQKPLPGKSAHSKLAPFFNGNNKRRWTPLPDSRRSAVLLLLWELEETLDIVFTLRSRNLLNHSGQISFPGGSSEAGETSIQTALRETFEEIGVENYNIEILGELSELFVLPSNSIIHPVVGYSRNYLDLKINKSEVEVAFSKPLDFFSFNNIKHKEWEVGNELIHIPYWDIHPSVPLWGATAMILAEFLEVYQSIGK